MGRAGFKKIKGLRVAYISGVDSDILGTEVWGATPKEKYLAHYFVKSDIENIIEQYDKLFEETGRPGVDILLCGQQPLGIQGEENAND